MITLKEMNIKLKKTGFTLIELIIASSVAVSVLTVSFALIGNIYFAQKKIRLSQNFYSEARFLLEKIVKISRENTIDYDRYFELVGPDLGNCASFDSNQVDLGGGSTLNNTINRTSLGYPKIFYWKISDNVYRNLGGVDMNGDIDPCAQSFHGDLSSHGLLLINKDRNIRTTIKSNSNRLQTSIELGADTDNDGIVDMWGENTSWNSGVCEINQPYSNGDTTPASLTTSINSEDLCYSAHSFENVSAKRLFIETFNFNPYPDRDPYLNFRNDSAQLHPNVFLYIKVNLLGYEDYAFSTQPTITMQTSSSSRILGNTRK